MTTRRFAPFAALLSVFALAGVTSPAAGQGKKDAKDKPATKTGLDETTTALMTVLEEAFKAHDYRKDPKHGNGRTRRDVNLVEDLAGSGERLNENGVLGRDVFWNGMQIPFGKRQEFAECARLFHDAEHGAVGAVAAKPARTPLARAACEVDLTGNALSDQIAIVRLDNLAHEFMTGRATKAVISALQFEIGIADSAIEQADHCVSLGAAGLGSFA